MRCPFLREAQVKFCRASAYKKMIVRLPGQSEQERCTSPEYVNCSAAKMSMEDRPSGDHCPFLHESLVQYCTAASMTKYIPYSESILSQCGTTSHRYCDLFLSYAQPEGIRTVEAGCDCALNPGQDLDVDIDGIKVPLHLLYSPNHLWLDIGSDGTLHVGIDALLAKSLGTIDRVSFVTVKGVTRPTVVLTVNDVDLQMVFPASINITKANTYLRTNPSKIISDPYGTGWLFEAVVPEQGEAKLREQLISGDSVQAWMKDEIRRMTSFVHQLIAQPDVSGAVLMADGGSFSKGFVAYIQRDEIHKLYSEFFSPLVSWRK